MLDDEFPEEVRRLKPRNVRISRHVERLLGDRPSDQMSEVHGTGHSLRPDSDSLNSICCAACGQTEYLSRAHCRCGHYLHGQIEDEYLAWVSNLRDMHEMIARDTERRLKPVRRLSLFAMPLLVGPMFFVFFSTTTSLTDLIWLVPGCAILAVLALADMFISRHTTESSATLETVSFETFLLTRKV